MSVTPSAYPSPCVSRRSAGLLCPSWDMAADVADGLTQDCSVRRHSNPCDSLEDFV
jgi:hypothetical protein